MHEDDRVAIGVYVLDDRVAIGVYVFAFLAVSILIAQMIAFHFTAIARRFAGL